MTYTLLKYIAIITMLIDHIGLRFASGNLYFILRYIGRIAFPIFAFQIVEGYKHTSNLDKYKKRLFIFALISEIPFNLFLTSSIINPFSQNVLFTLLLGLMVVEQLDKFRQKDKRFLRIILATILTLLSSIICADYGYIGVLTVITFYIFDKYKILQLVTLIIVYGFLTEGLTFSTKPLGMEINTQILGVIALLPIWLYNGKRGKTILEIIEDNVSRKAGIDNSYTTTDSNGNEVIIETISPNSDIKSLEEKAAQEITRLAMNSWKETKLRNKINKVIKYSLYSFYPLHMFILYLISIIGE